MAPIILKDVQIGLEPGSIKYEWSLEQAVSDTLLQDKFRQMTAFISNPEWIINSHIYWKHRKTLSFSSKTFPVPCEDQSACYFIAKDRIVKYDLIRSTTKEYVFSPLIDVNRITNQFLFVPLKDKGSQLVYYDFEKPDGENLSFSIFKQTVGLLLSNGKGSLLIHNIIGFSIQKIHPLYKFWDMDFICIPVS